MSSPWIITAEAGRFDLLCPSLEQVSVRVIALSTAKLCRWTGHCIGTYSIARHQVDVVRILDDEAQPYGYIHDGHESPIGDVNTPLKQAMRMLSPSDHAAYDQITEIIDRVKHQAFGLQWPIPEDIKRRVKYADSVMLATELRDIMPAGSPSLGYDLPPPIARRLVPDTPWREDAALYLDCGRDLHFRGLLPHLPGL